MHLITSETQVEKNTMNCEVTFLHGQQKGGNVPNYDPPPPKKSLNHNNARGSQIFQKFRSYFQIQGA